MTIENRLKEERNRLGFNQADFAGLAGRTKKTMIDYEKGASSPDARFLAVIAAAGADVQYILTGIRATSHAQKDMALPPRQKVLLDNFEYCSEEDQRAIERMALLASKAVDSKAEATEDQKEVLNPLKK